MKLTGFELNVIENLLNNPSKGGSIKDLRLIQKTLDKIREAKPTLPIEPKPPVPGSPEDTPENNQLYQEQHKAWDEEMTRIHDEEYECVLGQMYEILIKSRILSFNQFNNDENIRPRILAMADKFGIQ